MKESKTIPSFGHPAKIQNSGRVFGNISQCFSLLSSNGNGRVGRILLNNILLKSGLPPLNIDIKNQREYYEALQDYEKENNIRPTIELFLKEYKNLKKLVK